MEDDRPMLPTLVSSDQLERLGAEPLGRSVRVVKRRVIDRLTELQDAITAAERRASEAVAAAECEADELRQRATEAGAADGMRQFLETTAAREVARADARRLAERDMLELAFVLARQLVGRELNRDSSAYADLVAESVRQARQAPRITVRVHPTAAEMLLRHRRELAAHIDGVPIDIEEDARLEELDCVVETPHGTVDGRFEVRLDTLRRALSNGGDDE